jgi:GNAT superfamily N-acetyltransferase
MSCVDRQRIECGGLVIRTFEPEDAAAVWDLHLEGLESIRSFFPTTDPKWDQDVRDIPKHYLQPGSHFWVVEDTDRLIAMNAIRRVDDATAEIKRMRVTTDHRCQGIARLLLEIAEDFCRDTGYTRIVVDTTDRQEAAKIMYANYGYTETSNRWLEPIQTTIRYYEKHLR